MISASKKAFRLSPSLRLRRLLRKRTTTTRQCRLVADAARDIGRIIDGLSIDNDWVALGLVGNQLNNLTSDFDSRTYGFRKLSDLVKSMPQFEMQKDGQHLQVRRKLLASRAAKKAPTAPSANAPTT